jgi:hypothetical protein
MISVSLGSEWGGRLSVRCWAVVAGSVLLCAPTAAQQRVVMLDPTETVELEHSDRKLRLSRAAQQLAVRPPPMFTETVIDRSLLPDTFKVDVPVLRVVFSDSSFFDTASDALRPEAYRLLEVIAASLRGEAPDVAVFVAGHADDRGSGPWSRKWRRPRPFRSPESPFFAAASARRSPWRAPGPLPSRRRSNAAAPTAAGTCRRRPGPSRRPERVRLPA